MFHRCINRTVWVIVTIVCLCVVATPIYAAYRPDEVLVIYKPNRRAQVQSRISAAGAKVAGEISRIRTKRVKLPPGLAVEKAAAQLRADPNVEYAGPNHIVRICRTPNDEIYTDGLLYIFTQWGLYDPYYPTAGIQAPRAWDITTGSPDVIIANIDTGVESNHEDLYAKIIPGINTIDGENPNDTEDDHGHGTFTAGIAAAMTNNSIGIAGVAWGCKIMPIKALDSAGYGTEADAAEAIIWAADHGAHVINMSFGGYDDVPVEKAAIEYAWNKGCVLVGASGNDDSSDPFFPASYEQVLAVGASNENMQRCSPADWLEGGSNYGAYLDVVAPGNDIVSTTLTSQGMWGPYEISAGTSAAAPFASGVAALLKSAFPDWTNAQIVEQIKLTCTDIAPGGWDQYTGWGLINAYRALSEQLSDPLNIGALNDLPSGALARVSEAVITSGSNTLPGRFYVEQKDRACGVMIAFEGTAPAGYYEGDIVDITATVMTINGERALQGATMTKRGNQTPLRPLAMSTRSVGGTRAGLKSGITNGVGLNNIGLLVTVWGRVVSTFGWTYFYIDDGSGLFDGSGLPGLKISCGSMLKPAKGAIVRVTGIVSVERPEGTSLSIPVIRVRKQSDIMVIN